MLVGGISIAAFVPESYDHGVLFREREDVLPQDSSHIRDLHPFVIENPVLESLTLVGFAEILIDKTGIGACRFRQISGRDQLPVIPLAVVE